MFLLGLEGGVYVFFSSVVWQRQLCTLKWKVTTMCQRHMERLCLICKYPTLHSGLILTHTCAETALNGNKILSELVKVGTIQKPMNSLKCMWDFWKPATGSRMLHLTFHQDLNYLFSSELLHAHLLSWTHPISCCCRLSLSHSSSELFLACPKNLSRFI